MLYIALLLAIASQSGLTLSLDEAMSIALENNVSIREADEEIFQAKAGYRKSLSYFLPTVSFSSSYTRYPDEITQPGIDGNPVVIRAKGTHQTGFSLSLPLFTGGSRLANVALNSSVVRIAQEGREIAQNQIALGILTSYLGLIQASKSLKISRESLQMANDNLNLTQEMLRVGMATNLDVARSEVQVAQEEANLIKAENDLENAVNSLCDILQIEKTSINVVEPVFMDVQLPELDSCLKIALASPSMEIAYASLSSAKAGKTNVMSSFSPTLSAFAGYNWSGNNWEFGEPNYYGGVQLSWTLFQGTARIQDYSSASSQVRGAELALLDTHAQTLSSTEQSYREVKGAMLQYESALKTVRASQEAYELTDKMYKNGLATSLELFEAMNTLESAKLAEIASYYGIYISYAKLLSSMGVLTSFISEGGLYEK
ncbi:TolC family protein [candidate division WOR-3 bacterium]|nr:TolC family protein [candidate division WOR-3 bacterium]